MALESSFIRIFSLLESYSFTDIILPFLLFFTILFAVLQRVKLFGEEKKNINLILALLMSILAVVPHVTRRYPSNYDPVVIVNALIPSAAVLAVAIILVLMLLGIWGWETQNGVPAIAVIIILAVLTGVFGATVGWWRAPQDIFQWWNDDLTALLVIILVFGAIIAFITSDEKSTGFKDLVNGLLRRRP